MKQTIVIATTNTGKIREIEKLLLRDSFTFLSLKDFGPIPEIIEDGETFDENAYKKAWYTARYLGLPALADDSGLCVESLGGSPGVRSARYAGETATDQENTRKLLHDMEGVTNRKAFFECVISLAVPSGPALTYEGRCEGVIAEKPSGSSGFGYDPVFYYPPLKKTFAEISEAKKNKISHRGTALQELAREVELVKKWLQTRLDEIKQPKPDHEPYLQNDWSTELFTIEKKHTDQK